MSVDPRIPMAAARIVSATYSAYKIPATAAASSVLFGDIRSVSPLKLYVEGKEIPESFIVLSPMAKEFKLDLRHQHEYSGTTSDTATYSGVTQIAGAGFPVPNSGDFLVWRGLKVGDQVVVLKSNSSQLYYILHRKEGLTQV